MDVGEVFREVDQRVAGGRVRASYYPYRELKHTWRTRNGRLVFRISDYLRDSPENVLESLAWCLISRARGRKCPTGVESKYLRHARSSEFWSTQRSLYLSRARNLSFRSSGETHDLVEAFEYVNSCYFCGEMACPDLAWVKESPSRRIGFLHQPLGILAVNKALDSERVPRYVLEFVVYHELLHSILDCGVFPDRRVYHTREFRSRERAFRQHDEARNWLGRIASAAKAKSMTTEIVPQA